MRSAHGAPRRPRSDGNLDPSFAGDGVKAQSFRSDDWIEDMALQPSGKIVVVGAAQRSAPRAYAVGRFLP